MLRSSMYISHLDGIDVTGYFQSATENKTFIRVHNRDRAIAALRAFHVGGGHLTHWVA